MLDFGGALFTDVVNLHARQFLEDGS
jgi:hypothetical protein